MSGGVPVMRAWPDGSPEMEQISETTDRRLENGAPARGAGHMAYFLWRWSQGAESREEVTRTLEQMPDSPDKQAIMVAINGAQ